MIDVTFQHWSYVFSEEELIRYGSPHFDRKTAGRALSTSVVRNAKRVSTHRAPFDPKQILCANEAFPEAAVADPLADLDVWDDWHSGSRAFPYPGRYSRLGIRRQERKTSSTSSVGVLGEIMAGLYAQAGIAPWVLVRVIHHWPDFIFYIRDSDRYAFVEAKAYTREPEGQSRLGLDIPAPLLSECLVYAVQQLNADPYVQVWNAFTCIEQINPLRLQVAFLELDVSPNRRTRGTHSVLPAAVITGVAERAFRQSLLKISDSDLTLLRQRPQSRTSGGQRQLEQNILHIALEEELEELLIEAGPQVAVLASKQAIGEEIRQLLCTVTVDESEGQRFSGAREQAAEGGLSHIRFIGTQSLLVGDLDRRSRNAITNPWRSNWEGANEPWQRIGELSLWRCGGAVFAVGGREHEGTRIS